MSTNRKNPKNDQRGVVLMELVVASSIIAVVMAAVGFYFVYHVGTMNSGRAQLKLQRVGSLVMEEMAYEIRKGRATDLEENTVYSQLMITYPDASTHCFKLEGTDIKEGPDYNSLTPLEVLDDSQTVGSDTSTHRIYCDDLQFQREGDRVIIKFSLRHDLDNGDGLDDLTIDFGSAVKLRG
jgi:prepilin-type N-terminal cleavage/methylation domain-containing protein